MKSQLLSFVDCFQFGLSGLYVVSEDPSSCSSPCQIVATEYALARIEMDIGMASFENKFSLMSELVRTYDYERESFQIAA
jgi:catabolite regulation protein CreA